MPKYRYEIKLLILMLGCVKFFQDHLRQKDFRTFQSLNSILHNKGGKVLASPDHA